MKLVARPLVRRMKARIVGGPTKYRKRSALKRLVSSQSLVIDVGAHKGEFLSSLPRRNFTCCCVEPQSEYHSALIGIARRKNVTLEIIDGICLDVADPQAEFFVNVGTAGSSVLKPKSSQTDSKWLQVQEKRKVPQITLKELIDRFSIEQVDLLKVDAQGADLWVLRGAEEHLDPKTIKAVIVEINFHGFYDGQNHPDEILELMRSRGYFLADFFPSRNYRGWLFWADALFLPATLEYQTI
jgi:FkbM family methyltransferase